MDTKVCAKCGIEKDLSMFTPTKRPYKYGVLSECKPCKVIQTTHYNKLKGKVYLERNRNKTNKYKALYPEKYLMSVRMSNYKKLGLKITKAEYIKLYEDQDGKCKICNTVPTLNKKKLCLDHDHTTLKVRGLLCDNCNMALGKFKDDTKILQSAINYLSENNG